MEVNYTFVKDFVRRFTQHGQFVWPILPPPEMGEAYVNWIRDLYQSINAYLISHPGIIEKVERESRQASIKE
jgi:hypothetical protein